MAKVEAVRALCAAYPDDLALASSGADLCAPRFDRGGRLRRRQQPPHPHRRSSPAWRAPIPCRATSTISSRSTRPGVRLLTLAWGDNAFCGSAYGDGTGLTKKGADLVAACESLGVMVDVSHLSDRGFSDLVPGGGAPVRGQPQQLPLALPQRPEPYRRDDPSPRRAGRGHGHHLRPRLPLRRVPQEGAVRHRPVVPGGPFRGGDLRERPVAWSGRHGRVSRGRRCRPSWTTSSGPSTRVARIPWDWEAISMVSITCRQDSKASRTIPASRSCCASGGLTPAADGQGLPRELPAGVPGDPGQGAEG